MNIFGKILHKKGHRRAETILEVIVAIFVVSLGSTAGTTLVVSALRTNAVSRDNLVAINLAVEGAEAVRNIRDSNWLKYSYDKENCWNMDPGQNSCISTGKLADGNYAAYLKTEDMKWYGIAVTGGGLDLNSTAMPNDQYRLEFKDLNDGVDSNGDGTLTNDPDIFVSKDKGTASAGKSKFYRMINIAYAPIVAPATSSQQMTVTVLVQWKEQGVHQVKLSTILTNYNKVKVK